MTNINFAEYGRAFLSINIKPLSNSTMLPIEFKVDAGADNTTISKSDLVILGYDMAWIRQNKGIQTPV